MSGSLKFSSRLFVLLGISKPFNIKLGQDGKVVDQKEMLNLLHVVVSLEGEHRDLVLYITGYLLEFGHILRNDLVGVAYTVFG